MLTCGGLEGLDTTGGTDEGLTVGKFLAPTGDVFARGTRGSGIAGPVGDNGAVRERFIRRTNLKFNEGNDVVKGYVAKVSTRISKNSSHGRFF